MTSAFKYDRTGALQAKVSPKIHRMLPFDMVTNMFTPGIQTQMNLEQLHCIPTLEISLYCLPVKECKKTLLRTCPSLVFGMSVIR